MVMKRLISSLFIVGCLLIALPAQSQIRFGVKGGWNLSKADFSQSTKGKNYNGFFFGPTVQLKVPLVGLGLDGALMYSEKGVKADDNYSTSVKQKDIILPINLRYGIGGAALGIFVFAGPEFSFNIDKNGNDNLRDYSFKSSNMAFNFGLGLRLINHLEVGANYNIPLGKTADYSVSDAAQKIYDCRTKSLQVSLTYLF
jgi:hypothetical protein